MNGFNIQSNGLVGTPGNDWQIAGTGDFNGDGKSDILWRHDFRGGCDMVDERL